MHKGNNNQSIITVLITINNTVKKNKKFGMYLMIKLLKYKKVLINDYTINVLIILCI